MVTVSVCPAQEVPMEAVRRILQLDSEELKLLLPKFFRNKKVEVIVFPVEEDQPSPTPSKAELKSFLQSVYHIEEFPMPSREARNAW
jgi:hypothetical protein